MRIIIEIPETDVDTMIKNQISAKVQSLVVERFKDNVQVEKLIDDTIVKFVERSEFLKDNRIRNLVQQKIARELSNSFIFQPIKDSNNE
jgi:hypothetical protein